MMEHIYYKLSLYIFTHNIIIHIKYHLIFWHIYLQKSLDTFTTFNKRQYLRGEINHHYFTNH